jgi:hypothetical protein
MVSTREQILIRHERALRESLKIRPPRRLVFAINELTQPENRYWEQKINVYRAECGCKAGAVALLASAALCPLFLYLLNIQKPLRLDLEIFIWVVSVLCSALIGKASGISRARWLLKRALSHVTALVRERRRQATSYSEA